jgi:hypothetical protein
MLSHDDLVFETSAFLSKHISQREDLCLSAFAASETFAQIHLSVAVRINTEARSSHRSSFWMDRTHIALTLFP